VVLRVQSYTARQSPACMEVFLNGY